MNRKSRVVFGYRTCVGVPSLLSVSNDFLVLRLFRTVPYINIFLELSPTVVISSFQYYRTYVVRFSTHLESDVDTVLQLDFNFSGERVISSHDAGKSCCRLRRKLSMNQCGFCANCVVCIASRHCVLLLVLFLDLLHIALIVLSHRGLSMGSWKNVVQSHLGHVE